MTSTTDPTVPLPTSTDVDDDDDDDDLSSMLIPGQSPVGTTPPAQTTIASVPSPTLIPPPADLAVPGLPSAPTIPTPPITSTSASGLSNIISQSSATGLADSLPSDSPTPLSSADPTNGSNSSGDGLSVGASAGVGVGVALIVCLAALGLWLFVRRRKARRTKTRSTPSHSFDEEHTPQAQKSEIYAYRAEGPAEVSGDEKPRRWSELESPTNVVEAGEGRVFRAELPGSAPAGHKDGSGRLFTDAPIDDVDETREIQENPIDKKRERLFSDPPIDEEDDTADLKFERSQSPVEKG